MTHSINSCLFIHAFCLSLGYGIQLTACRVSLTVHPPHPPHPPHMCCGHLVVGIVVVVDVLVCYVFRLGYLLLITWHVDQLAEHRDRSPQSL
jgi:hypothetical protein